MQKKRVRKCEERRPEGEGTTLQLKITIFGTPLGIRGRQGWSATPCPGFLPEEVDQPQIPGLWLVDPYNPSLMERLRVHLKHPAKRNVGPVPEQVNPNGEMGSSGVPAKLHRCRCPASAASVVRQTGQPQNNQSGSSGRPENLALEFDGEWAAQEPEIIDRTSPLMRSENCEQPALTSLRPYGVQLYSTQLFRLCL